MTISSFNTDKMPAQKAFMESTDRELLYSGAFGAGKSRVLCEKGLFLSLAYPGNVGAILRKTLISLRKTTLITWDRYVCPPELVKSFNQETMTTTLVNGSIIFWLGLDDEQKIGSLEAGWIGIDEAIELTEDDYIMLLGRLRLTSLKPSSGLQTKLPFRQIMSATNPSSDAHWLYKRAYTDKKMRVLESNSLDNIHTPQDYKDSLKAFTGVYYDRFVLGKWVGAAGIVYDNFDTSQHLIDKFTIPNDWTRYRAIDFGFSNPFVCLWVAIHPNIDKDQTCTCPAVNHTPGTMYVYREIYMSQRTIEQHARDIVYLSLGENIKATFSDWAAGDRATLELNGVPTYKADKSISAGIQSVYSSIGQNRLYIMRNILVEHDLNIPTGRPHCTADEIGLYRYADPSKRLGNIREEPIDKDNHGMDALRYLIHTLVLKSIANIPVIAIHKSGMFASEVSSSRWSDAGIFDKDYVQAKWN